MLDGDKGGIIGDIDRDLDGIYDDNLNCTWIITASNGSAVQLKFLDLDIPICEETGACDTDYIQVS